MRRFNSLKTWLTFAGIAGGVIFNLVSHAATITWTNTAGGNWSSATNWTPNSVPGANDLAIITNNGVYSVVLDISPSVAGLTLGGASGTQTLSMNGQTLSLNGPLTINPNGAYTLDVRRAHPSAIRMQFCPGTLNWVNGSPGGILTLAAGSTLNITSANDHNLPNCTFTNNGTVAWSNGRIRGGGATSTAIYNNGLWDSQADLVLNDDFAVSNTVFNNYGTFRKSAGTGTGTIVGGGVLFNQLGGEVDVQSGTFALQGGGNLDGGFVTTNQSGTMLLSAGSFNFNGAVTSSNTVQNAGNLVGNNVIRGQLTWSAGTWNGGITVTIATNSTMFLAGGNGNLLFYRLPEVTNYGTVAWVNGYPDGGNTPGTLIYNYGLWDCQSDYAFRNDGSGSGTVFNNYGTFRKSAGTGTGTIVGGGVLFNQLGGEVDVQSGTFALQGGGNLDGGFVTTNQSGTMLLSAGSFNFNGAVTSSNTVENAGNLVGNNVIRGQLTWSGGTWSGGITVTIATNSTVFLAGGGGNLLYYSCLITNYGTVAWVSGYPDGGNTPGTLIYNYGLWDCRSDYTFRNDGNGNGTVFNNFGTFRKSAGTGSGTITAGGVLFNQLGGEVDVQSGAYLCTCKAGGNLDGGFVTTNQSGINVIICRQLQFQRRGHQQQYRGKCRQSGWQQHHPWPS